MKALTAAVHFMLFTSFCLLCLPSFVLAQEAERDEVAEVCAGAWDGSTWTCSPYMGGEPCPLPSFVDPKGEMRLVCREHRVYLQRKGKETLLGYATDSFDFASVKVADIDFDGEPEFFIMVTAGSAGEFYAMTDANGNADKVKQLFGPYLNKVSIAYDGGARDYDFIFDCFEFDRTTRSIKLSSPLMGESGLVPQTRTFTFNDGAYTLSRVESE